MKHNSFMNATLHLLLHVPPLRDYFILDPLPSSQRTSELVRRFGMLARKLWNPRQFKAQVSPHELLQEVGNASGGRFSITKEGDPVEFLGWLLNQLHRDLGGTRKPRSSASLSPSSPSFALSAARGSRSRTTRRARTDPLFLPLPLPPPSLPLAPALSLARLAQASSTQRSSARCASTTSRSSRRASLAPSPTLTSTEVRAAPQPCCAEAGVLCGVYLEQLRSML